ncbi:MAG TPA: MFS transporter [bacterium]|jgi:putative MFS transporter|nr:MFS transporter [bacterium]
MLASIHPSLRRQTLLLIVVAALGNFVDVYDLLLFSLLRTPSLTALGVPPDQLLAQGLRILNWQALGLLLGGVLWGVLGDKRGRLSVLFGSIFLYSLANILNGLVTSVDQYAFLRFLSGLGLAGELGAGVTLVAEIMPTESRGLGTSLVAAVGVLGGAVGIGVAGKAEWRHAYFIGGGLGLALLALRVGLAESSLFKRAAEGTVERGRFFSLFSSPKHFMKYLKIICIGLPLWYLIGILITFCPEFGLSFGLSVAPSAGFAVAVYYIGLAVGDMSSGLISQHFKSRRKVIAGFMAFQMLGVGLYFTLGRASLEAFYACCIFVGVAGGYWALFVTMGAEQYGTNLRATVATTAPNMVRGALVPMTFAFSLFRAHGLGLSGSALLLGVLVFAVALWGLWGTEESFGRDLDYLERD